MEKALLVLCPLDPNWILSDDTSLFRLLHSIQFIGEPYDIGKKIHLPGERFLDLIAFMGCAPEIRLEPGDSGQEFCYIRLPGKTDLIEFRCGEHTVAPRCPRCGAAVEEWRNRILCWQQRGASELWSCGSCACRAAPWDYRWRKSAGFGRCFIEINNIYPREAVPQQQLLDTLHSHYQVDWQYFYQY